MDDVHHDHHHVNDDDDDDRWRLGVVSLTALTDAGVYVSVNFNGTIITMINIDINYILLLVLHLILIIIINHDHDHHHPDHQHHDHDHDHQCHPPDQIRDGSVGTTCKACVLPSAHCWRSGRLCVIMMLFVLIMVKRMVVLMMMLMMVMVMVIMMVNTHRTTCWSCLSEESLLGNPPTIHLAGTQSQCLRIEY